MNSDRISTNVTSKNAPPERTAPQFRPASLRAFHLYATNLAWLMEVPLQVAQELLSRIYGYKGLYVLQQAMKTAGEAGPFEETPDNRWNLLNPRHLNQHDETTRLVREMRLSIFGVRNLLKARDSMVFRIKLFDAPRRHLAAFRQLRAQIETCGEQLVIDNDVNEFLATRGTVYPRDR